MNGGDIEPMSPAKPDAVTEPEAPAAPVAIGLRSEAGRHAVSTAPRPEIRSAIWDPSLTIRWLRMFPHPELELDNDFNGEKTVYSMTI